MITAHYSDSYQGYLKKGMQNVILLSTVCVCVALTLCSWVPNLLGGGARHHRPPSRDGPAWVISTPSRAPCSALVNLTRVILHELLQEFLSLLVDYQADQWSPFLGDSDCETYLNITKAKFSFEYSEFDEISAEAQKFVTMLLNPQMKWVSSNLVKTWKMWINLFPRD